MGLEPIDAVITEVNALAARHHGFDLEVWSYRSGLLEVSGTGGWAGCSDLRVGFIDVCWASNHFPGWKSDTKRPIFQRVEGTEAFAINARFDIEILHHPFKFSAEDGAEPMWVAAREIRADCSRLELGTRPADPT